MSIKPACFIQGISLLRISMAADAAAWAANKERFDEAHTFLYAAKQTILEAKEADFLTEEQVEGMMEAFKEGNQAIDRGDTKKVRESLAALGSRAVDAAFQKVVECETRER